MFGSTARPTLFPLHPVVRPTSSHRRAVSPLNVGFAVFASLFLLFATIISAAQVTLAWDPVQAPGLAGYKLYYGYTSGSYEGILDVGMETTYTLIDLEEGQPYYFAVVAYDADGQESELSREVAHNGPAGESEEDSDEDGLSDQVEVDEADAHSEPILEEAHEMDADEHDPMPALEQELEDNRDNNRSEARTALDVVPQSQLKIISVDSEPLVGDGAAEAVNDGQAETFWRTVMGSKAPIHPHELVINLGGEYTVRGFRYLPRQDGKLDGMVARYSFYVSEDGVDWGKAVMTGTFSRDVVEQEVTFPGKLGSFVRFVAHSEVNGKPWTSVAEFNVLGVP